MNQGNPKQSQRNKHYNRYLLDLFGLWYLSFRIDFVVIALCRVQSQSRAELHHHGILHSMTQMVLPSGFKRCEVTYQRKWWTRIRMFPTNFSRIFIDSCLCSITRFEWRRDEAANEILCTVHILVICCVEEIDQESYEDESVTFLMQFLQKLLTTSEEIELWGEQLSPILRSCHIVFVWQPDGIA